MARIKAKILQITRAAVLVEVRGKAWLPKGSVELPPGELLKGAEISIKLPRRLAEKKGLARPVYGLQEET